MIKNIITAFLCCIFFVSEANGELTAKYRGNYQDVIKHSNSDELQINCLTYAILREAGNEPIKGKAAVARVIINRENAGVADTICRVIGQRTRKQCQFSFACQTKIVHVDNNQWIKCNDVARAVIEQDEYQNLIPSNTMYFNGTHGIKFNPVRYKTVAIIGNQRFYVKTHSKT